MANVQPTDKRKLFCENKYNRGGSNDLDVYLIKNAPIPVGSSLELIDGTTVK